MYVMARDQNMPKSLPKKQLYISGLNNEVKSCWNSYKRFLPDFYDDFNQIWRLV